MVLTVATAIGAMGVLETFLLFSLADHVFGLSRDAIRTVIYLKLSVSGHLTIFVTRTRGPFWSKPAPARLLFGAVVGTQVLATCITVFGVLMTSIKLGVDRLRLGLRTVLVPRGRPGQARHLRIPGPKPPPPDDAESHHQPLINWIWVLRDNGRGVR